MIDDLMAGMAYDQFPNIYSEVPGGPELLRWFGETPSFHDAEIVSLDLRRWGLSTLRVHGFIANYQADLGCDLVFDKHAIVTFAMEDIMDLQLDGFSHQNVIGGLILQRATDRGRANYYSHPQSPEDIEIELEPCYGLDGVIRAKRVSISFEPGIPDGPSIYRDGS
ncbi:hypothetical protein [uncultured Bosea sp.]|uniref:hypothetical protein n=1 Tax=uncultured Bosea sp. TaxID=211457 RepID=UPI00345BC191